MCGRSGSVWGIEGSEAVVHIPSDSHHVHWPSLYSCLHHSGQQACSLEAVLLQVAAQQAVNAEARSLPCCPFSAVNLILLLICP